MAEWRPVDETTVLRAWAIAEAMSQKTPLGKAVARGRYLPEMTEKLLSGRHEALSDSEWRALERDIVETRSALLQGLNALHPQWYEGHASAELLREIRFFNLPDWTAKTPSRRLVDLSGDRNLPGREPEFRGFSTSVERPIAVGPSLDGPLCLVEGYTRCCAILRDCRAGLLQVQQVPMIIGITSRIREWTNGQGHRWW